MGNFKLKGSGLSTSFIFLGEKFSNCSKGIKELKATLRISHMIPVPKTELELYDLENEEDLAYKELVQNEVIFIRRNKNKIENNAKLIYKQKIENDLSAGYIKSALDYQGLEERCLEFEKGV